MFEITSMVVSYMGDQSIKSIVASFDHLFEVLFFLITYVFIDIIFKRIKINKTLKSLINISIAAFLCSFLEINVAVFTGENTNVIEQEYHKVFGFFFINSLKEFIEIFLYLFTAYIVQLIIQNYLLKGLALEGSGFISKIPEEYRGSIYLIKSKENYIDVFYGNPNENRHKLINYRFSNALKEIDSGIGTQIHRSHWVSIDSLKTLRRVDRKYYITSKNNETLPISQTYIKSIKEIKDNLS